jgi:pimeloyl-ACP methyl ester carboxylesterase
MDCLEGVASRTVATDRIETHYLESGARDGVPVVCLHGSTSDSRYWERTLRALPEGYRGIAPDRRGCGYSETAPVDGTAGMADLAADVDALLDALGSERPGRRLHLVGWSFGGGIAMRYTIDHPATVASLTLLAPIPPQGFGGTSGPEADPCFPDYAGSGAGLVDEEYLDRMRENDRSTESPLSPRNVLTDLYCDPETELDPDHEDRLLESMLRATIGPGNYPGDAVPSDNWPGQAPGPRGERNAMSPKYCDLTPLAGVEHKPDVLWIRGGNDRVVSAESLLDYGYLGQQGELDDWPGPDVFPPQPMIEQTRVFFESYAAAGGGYEEVVLDGVGHTPHVEAPARFRSRFHPFLDEHTG